MLSAPDLLALALATRPTLDPEADAAAFLAALQDATGMEGALWACDEGHPDRLAATAGWPIAPPPAAALSPGRWRLDPAPAGPHWPALASCGGRAAVVDLDGRYHVALCAPPGISLDDDALGRLQPVLQRLGDTIEAGRRHQRLREEGERPWTVRTRLLGRLVELADAPPDERLGQALAMAADLLGLGIAIVSRIDEAAGTYTVVACHAPEAPLEPGQVFPLGQTYCSITLEAPDVLAIEAMRTSPHAAHPCYEAFGLESYIGLALTFADGSRGTLNVSDAAPRDRPFTEADREVLRVLGAWVVATADRARSAEALRESQAHLRTVIDQLPVVLFALDAGGRVTLSEGHGLAALGLAPGEVVGASVFDLYSEDVLRGIRKTLAGTPASWQATVGDTVWETHATPQADPAGRPAGLLAVAFDVTERETAARAVAAASARLERVLGATPDAIVFADPDHCIEYVNPAFAEVFGVALDEAIGRRSQSFFAAAADAEAFEEIGDDESTTVRYRRRDGSTFVGETERAPIVDGDGATLGHVAVIRDVTAREAMREAMERERARYERLVEHAADLIFQLNPEGRITFANAAAAEVLGYEAEDLLGRSFAGLIPDDHREAVVTFYRDQAERAVGATHLEVPVVARDGETVWLEQNVVRVEAEGGVFEFHVVARDVTERRRVEGQLRHARETAEAALRTKETFLANVSHEMRTPLHAVLGLSRLLAAGPVSASQADLVTGVARAADTLLALIDDLLDRARLDTDETSFHEAPFFLADVLDDIRHLLAPIAEEKGVAIEVAGPDGVDTLLGDAKRLRQILLNLGGNAVKFTEAGWVRVSAAIERREPAVVLLRFEVEDTGIGIPMDQQSRIFEAFVQASDHAARAHGGTGLGLSIVRDLVERQGGTIAVESVEGAGSRFIARMPFRLAAVDEDAAPAATASAPVVAKDADLAGLHVLIVEDNPTNRFIARHQVNAWGMTADEAASGQEALDWLAAGHTADLVLMDLQMPGMDGIETTRRIRAAGHTGLPVVALTASALASRRGATLEAGFSDFVLKPFEPAELRRRLGLLLGRIAPSSSDTTAIDRDRLRTSAVGDPEAERVLVAMFLEEVMRAAPLLLAAAGADDRPRLQAEAHSLKGQAAYVGATSLVEALARLEEATERPDGPGRITEATADATAALADAVWVLRVLYPSGADAPVP